MEDRFALPRYGKLMEGRRVWLCRCPEDLASGIGTLFLSQGAEVVRDGTPPEITDVLVCGVGAERPDPGLSAAELTARWVGETERALQACRFGMERHRYGTVVQMLPPWGEHSVPGHAAETAAAGALGALIRAFSAETCRFHIRANCLSLPFSMWTDGWDPDMQLLRRPGTSLDVAEAALYLASPMSAFLTGETLPVNGGGFVIGHNQVWERYLEKV